MADTIETRVANLERDVRALAARVDTNDPRIEATEQDLQGIPALIRAEARLVASRDSRLLAEMADLSIHIDERFTQMAERFKEVDARFDAVLRAVAETIVARGPRRS